MNPFTSKDFTQRMERAVMQAAEAGLTGLLVTPGPDLTYFTGYQPTAITERVTVLVLDADHDPHLIVPVLERPDATASAGASAVIITDWADGADQYAAAARLLDPSGRYAISDSAWAMHLLGLQQALPGSGPNGANPHHQMGDRVIQRGDTVVLDFGGLKDGYGSDTTRTVHVGPPTAEALEIFDVVRRAQQAAFEAARPGIPCQEIDRMARRAIGEAGYEEYFIHRTGHGIGLTTHELPYMVEGEQQTLVPGMCFSIEPGVYLPGRFGVRIEDIVSVTETGGRRLNNTSHALHIVA